MLALELTLPVACWIKAGPEDMFLERTTGTVRLPLSIMLLYNDRTIVCPGAVAMSAGAMEALRMCRERMLARRVVLPETSAGTAEKASLLGAASDDVQVSFYIDQARTCARLDDSPSKVLLLPCNWAKSAAPSVVLATL